MQDNTNFKLKIGTPCHEKWALMQEEEQGRFCLACQKTVVDFTKMSEEEIITFFESYAQRKQATTNICGRFSKTQLQKKYSSKGAAFSAPSRHRGGVYSLIAAALIALSAPSLQAAAATPIDPIAWVAHSSSQKVAPVDPLAEGFFADMMRMARQLQGSVYDQNGKIAPRTLVQLYNAEGIVVASTKSDKDGKFAIPLTQQIQKSSGLYLYAEINDAIGSLSVSAADFDPSKPVQLKTEEIIYPMMGDIMIDEIDNNK